MRLITPGRTYNISLDGQWFLMIKEGPGTAENARQIILVQSWFDELRRRVPTNTGESPRRKR